MIETMNDVLSLAVMIGAVAAGIYAMLAMCSRPDPSARQKRSDRYYDFYESVDDEYDEGSKDLFYYE